MTTFPKTGSPTHHAKVSAKGWVVIPAPLRRRYRIEPGQTIRIVDYGDVLSLVPSMADPVRGGRGLLASDGTSLTAALLDERRSERRRER